MTDAAAIAAKLTKAQRRYMRVAPIEPHHCYNVRPAQNWGGTASALSRQGLLARIKRRPWDAASTFEYQFTDFGLAVRAILQEQTP